MLRSLTALALLLANGLPACSATRFNSTAGGVQSDEATADAGFEASASVAPRKTDSDGTTATTLDAATETTQTTIDTYLTTSLEPATTNQTATSSRPATDGTSAGATWPALSSGADGGAASSVPNQTTSPATAELSNSGPNTETPSTQPALDTSSASPSKTSADSAVTATIEGGSTHAPSDAGPDASLGETLSEHTSAESDASATDAPTREISGDTELDSQNAASSSPRSTTDEPTAPPVVCTETRNLPGVVRDFSEGHVDMEPCDDVDCRAEKGLVDVNLGTDGKPVLSRDRVGASTVYDSESFNQWFNDVERVNTPVPFTLRITTQRYRPPQKIGFDSADPPPDSPAGFGTNPKGFFPIDELNETTRPHNYSFTYEVTSFIEYTGGETLTIRGDDDIFVFIDRRLAIDLGGIHLPEEATVELDELGLEPGNVYDFRIFFAERHVEQSNLYLSTTARFMTCTGG